MFLRHVDLLMAASLSAFAISATPSHAADDQQAQRASYADLNLNTQAGARTLGMRLRAAARRVCAMQADEASTVALRCERTAIDDARRSLEDRQVQINPAVWDVARR